MRAKNAALMSVLAGDSDTLNLQTRQKRAELVERIRAKREPQKSEYYAKTQEQLQYLQTNNPASLSPDCVAKPFVQSADVR